MSTIFFGIVLFFITVACQSTTNEKTITSVVTTITNEQNEKGKALFLKNCATCHNHNMIQDMTGPALSGVVQKWENRAELIQFIQDPQTLINNNHPRARAVAELWPSEMLAFPQLDSMQVELILEYVELF